MTGRTTFQHDIEFCLSHPRAPMCAEHAPQPSFAPNTGGDMNVSSGFCKAKLPLGSIIVFPTEHK